MGDIEDPRSRAGRHLPRLSSLLSQESLGVVLDKLGRILHRVLAKQREPARGAVEKRASQDLNRLKSGELTVDEYLDAKVEVAVAPLEGVLHADDLGYVRAVVRDRLETDPRLRQLLGRLLRELEPPSEKP